MNAYSCTECDWEYEVWTMGDRVKAVKQHQLIHLLERYGWLNGIEDVVDTLMIADETRPGEFNRREALVR